MTVLMVAHMFYFPYEIKLRITYNLQMPFENLKDILK